MLEMAKIKYRESFEGCSCINAVKFMLLFEKFLKKKIIGDPMCAKMQSCHNACIACSSPPSFVYSSALFIIPLRKLLQNFCVMSRRNFIAALRAERARRLHFFLRPTQQVRNRASPVYQPRKAGIGLHFYLRRLSATQV